MSVILHILIAAFGIGLLLLVHELGHFLVAKAAGVTVERFSLGFGPEIVGFTRGGTRYSLRVLPIGGYVKMLGDEPGSEDAEGARSFLGQSFSRKAAIVVAGSGMNVILALVLFVAVFQIGVRLLEAKVGAVGVGTPAAYADLRAGDLITAVNGRRDVDFGDLAAAVILTDPGDPIDLEIQRDGQRLEKTLYSVSDPDSGVNVLGIPPYQTLTIDAMVRFSLEENGDGDEAEARSPSEEAGLAPGWTLAAFNGVPLESWYDYERMVVRNGLEPYTVTAVKDGVEKTFNVTPVRSPHPFLGIAPAAVEVSKVNDGSLAHEMGLAAGDTILGLGGALVTGREEIQYALARKLKDPPPLIIERAGKKLELVWPRRPRDTAEFMKGFELTPETRLSGILSLSAAEMLGLQPGDIILAVDGRKVTGFEELRSFLSESEGDTIAVRWSRDGAEYEGSFSPVFPDMVGSAEERLWKLGFSGACRVGTRKALDFASQVYRIITKIITGQRGIARNIGGPITIARASYTIAAQRSPTEFMLFLAIISINLGVVNLLPIPILDGGLLVVFIIEKLKGSPISVRTQVAIQYMGLAMIILIFVFVTYQDIMRFFR